MKKGFGLVEVVVGVAIMTLTLYALFFASQSSLRLSREATRRVQASFLLEEGAEALRTLRDRDWNNLPASGDFYLLFSSGQWATTSSPEIIDDFFKRTITASPVYRDGSDDISPSGTLDSDTLLFTVAVEWPEGDPEHSASLRAYLTNMFK